MKPESGRLIRMFRYQTFSLLRVVWDLNTSDFFAYIEHALNYNLVMFLGLRRVLHPRMYESVTYATG